MHNGGTRFTGEIFLRRKRFPGHGPGCLRRRLQRAHDGARRCDDFAVPFAGEHADECSELLLEWGAPRVHGPTPGT